MDNVLVASSSQKGLDALIDVFKLCGFVQVDTASGGNEVRRRLIDDVYDLAVINTPLMDEAGIDLAIDISDKCDGGVILLVKAEMLDQIQEKVESYGIYVVGKPINKQLLYQAVKLSTATARRIELMRKKNSDLVKRLEDTKIVDRAKCCLIQCLKFTEPQAHRHIEKLAMDMRMSKRAVAENILKTYEI